MSIEPPVTRSPPRRPGEMYMRNKIVETRQSKFAALLSSRLYAYNKCSNREYRAAGNNPVPPPQPGRYVHGNIRLLKHIKKKWLPSRSACMHTISAATVRREPPVTRPPPPAAREKCTWKKKIVKTHQNKMGALSFRLYAYNKRRNREYRAAHNPVPPPQPGRNVHGKINC